ncbi:uncharacterized protein LOC126576978 [Anopheles aquasalis]|uniref:uncharacterized protein LOC126576978 n=1 Tax=Anopheles aquasalis TaxID=42839 RepID=UPI00215AAC06|nr:uncharacterized protein LOC126576978 [Anopheles aquasalis]
MVYGTIMPTILQQRNKHQHVLSSIKAGQLDATAFNLPASTHLKEFVAGSANLFRPGQQDQEHQGTSYHCHMLLYLAREAKEHGVLSMGAFEQHIAKCTGLGAVKDDNVDVLKDVVEKVRRIERERQPSRDVPVPLQFAKTTTQGRYPRPYA